MFQCWNSIRFLCFILLAIAQLEYYVLEREEKRSKKNWEEIPIHFSYASRAKCVFAPHSDGSASAALNPSRNKHEQRKKTFPPMKFNTAASMLFNGFGIEKTVRALLVQGYAFLVLLTLWWEIRKHIFRYVPIHGYRETMATQVRWLWHSNRALSSLCDALRCMPDSNSIYWFKTFGSPQSSDRISISI